MNLEDLVGIPYEDFGRDPARGLDCTGLILELFHRLGHDLTDPMEDPDGAEGELVPVKGNRRFADVIEVDPHAVGLGSHLGFYLGMGLVVHVHRARGVEIIPLRHLAGEILSTLRLAEYVENP
jgi:cell wall-associated NlpC family hydrolase